MKHKLLLSLISSVCVFAAGAALAEDIDIRGSTTVNSVLIAPNKALIEATAGHKLKVTLSNSGRGLADLIGFSADIAMISAPFKDVTDQLAKTPSFQGLKVDAREFNVVKLGSAEVLFVVHPSSKVKQLTRAELAGIFSGRTKNWSEVGGEDQAITVVSEAKGGAMRAEIDKVVLNGQDITAGAKLVELAPQIPLLVAGTPGSIGFISSVLPTAQRSGVGVILDDVKILQTLYVVTRPRPSESVMKTVDAIKEVAKRTLSF